VHALSGTGLLFARAVGEVQPRHVHPRLDHAGQDLGVVGGRADGGNDLGAAHRRTVAGAAEPGGGGQQLKL
jgi:hypothetical protein